MLSSGHFPFLQLPLELRIQIYCYVLLGSLRSDALACDIDTSILQTCKQIHFEGWPFLYKVNVFEAAIWLPVPKYTPWPILPSNRAFLSRVQHLILYWDARQFYDGEHIPFENPELRKSILHLKQICMSLIQAGTKLQTLKITTKVPGNITFGHMPLGQYPLLSLLSARVPLFKGYSKPDVLAPLKELRVRHATFTGDFSEASPATKAYLHDVKDILEGYGWNSPRTISENAELDLDLMRRRKICHYASALEFPTGEDIVHREILFYITALREYYLQKDELGDKLEDARLILSHPRNESLKGLIKIKLGPIFVVLEDAFRAIGGLWQQRCYGVPQDIVAAREYLMARPEIQKMIKSAGSGDSR